MNDVPNKVYSQGMEGRDSWEQVSRHVGTDSSQVSNMVATAFYTGDKFGLFIDLRSVVDRKNARQWPAAVKHISRRAVRKTLHFHN